MKRMVGLLMLLPVLALPSGIMESKMTRIESLIYVSEAGAILPELQWYEEIAISRKGVQLKRNGKVPNSRINSGTWQLSLELGLVEKLFSDLSGFDCISLRRIEPELPPDGAGRESFHVVFLDGRRCTVNLDPGVTVSGAEVLMISVREFLKTLTFPVGSGRYIEDE